MENSKSKDYSRKILNVLFYVIGIAFVAIIISAKNFDETHTQTPLSRQIDSLTEENFNLTIERDRYEYVIGQLKGTCKTEIDSLLLKSE